MIPNWLASAVVVALTAPMLSGCALLVAGGAVAGVQTARQERTIGDALDDRAIKTTLDAKLRQTSGLRFGVATTVVEGRVLLAGRVSQPEARLDATRVAWTVDGRRKVDNDIEVAETAGWLDRPQRPHHAHAARREDLGDSSIREVNYTTDVVHGVVYLMGVGQDQEEVDRVVAHARQPERREAGGKLRRVEGRSGPHQRYVSRMNSLGADELRRLRRRITSCGWPRRATGRTTLRPRRSCSPRSIIPKRSSRRTSPISPNLPKPRAPKPTFARDGESAARALGELFAGRFGYDGDRQAL